MSVLFKSLRLINDKKILPARDYFYDGREIKAVEKDFLAGKVEKMDCSNLLASKGWTDLRCFVGEPGLEYKENLESLGEVLKVSGFAEAVILPNTHPVIQTKNDVAFIQSKVKDFFTNIHVQSAVTVDTKGEDLTEMLDVHKQGVRVFGEGLVPLSNSDRMMKVLQYLQKIDGILFDHSYDPLMAIFGHMHEGLTSTKLGLKGIPSFAEEIAIQKNIEILRYTGGNIHFQTISTEGSVDRIRRAKAEGLQVTADVSLYQLLFLEDDLMGFDTNLKVLPPFRSMQDREALIEGLKDGTIDAIVSNHLPQDFDSKHMEFDLSSFGMSGLQTFLAALVRLEPELGWPLLIQKITDGPSGIIGSKSSVLDSLTLFDPNEEWEFNSKSNRSLSYNSPWYNTRVKGKVRLVINKNKMERINE